MRSLIVLAFVGMSVAFPFGANFEARHNRPKHHPKPSGTGYPHPPPAFPTGTRPHPYPTGTAPPFPSGTDNGAMSALPWGPIPTPAPVERSLEIDYHLAPRHEEPFSAILSGGDARPHRGDGYAHPTGTQKPHHPKGTGRPHGTGKPHHSGRPQGTGKGGPRPTGLPPMM
ncbi:hypothetical protein BU26DRAFT_510253 [Trematosphaeria pertusa]|uniref:Uncharacterized protein n=1 Tax=Trematosphaeria pertusa TaxID=390896 RepID=A0A6A6I0F4_9PLEO|nr:uncharacterized protein BU26DRAFT_510253 [Trematosphaeria pertusa]KAF2243050.1 hypothetical protein BU26DRAFT_510253 [Trematosphaeria pertusa]